MRAIEESIRMWRSKNGLTQEQVADKLSVSQSTYNNWENGRRQIPFKYYAAIARIMEVGLSELVPDNVKADVKDELNPQEVFKLDVKAFLRMLEDNNGLLKTRCKRLEEENIRLVAENKALKSRSGIP